MSRIAENAAPIRASPLQEIAGDFSLELMEREGKKVTTVKGVAAKANIINRNGRYYSREVYQKAIDEAKEDLSRGKVIGLLDHPNFDEPLKGNVKNIAVKWERLELVGDDVVIEGIILGTSAGKEIEALADAKVALGISTNGVGSKKYQKTKEVIHGAERPDEIIEVIQDDYRFMTIDIVNDPANIYGQLAQESRNIMTLEELKVKDPSGYARLMAEAAETVKPVAIVDNTKDVQALEAQLIAVKAEAEALKKEQATARRERIVTQALAEAGLPKLEKVGEIDLDARFRKHLENAALSAATDEDAKKEITEMIEERKALVGNREGFGRNTPDIPEAKGDRKKEATTKDKDIGKMRQSAGLN